MIIAKNEAAKAEPAKAPAKTEAAGDRLPLVKMVASIRGVYKGAMVEPGQTFFWDPNPREPGGKVKPPKWAAPPGQEAKKQPPNTEAFDTRPVAAQLAATRKQRSGGAV